MKQFIRDFKFARKCLEYDWAPYEWLNSSIGLKFGRFCYRASHAIKNYWY